MVALELQLDLQHFSPGGKKTDSCSLTDRASLLKDVCCKLDDI